MRTGQRPSALWLTNEVPYPPYNGGQRREYELMRRLGLRWEISVIVVSANVEVDTANAKAIEERGTVVRCVVLEAQDDVPPHFIGRERDHFSSYIDDIIDEIAKSQRAELLHVEGYFMSTSVGTDRLPIVLVDENVEYDVERLWAVVDPTRISIWSRVRDRERAEWRRAAALGAVCEPDAQAMRSEGLDPVVVANGWDHIPFLAGPRRRLYGSPRLCFLAGTAYWPTADALAQLVDEVWPSVRAALPHATVVITGSPEMCTGLGAGIKHAGMLVDGLAEFLSSCDGIAAPIRVGGGTKLKCLETLAAGRPIFTTKVGAYGIAEEALGGAVVVGTPTELAAEIVAVANDQSRWTQLIEGAVAARRFLPTWDDAAAALMALWDSASASKLTRARTRSRVLDCQSPPPSASPRGS